MANNIKIFDTTLRDGEQAPGATMTLNEKIAIAELLDLMNVDIIEAGFAIASQGDFEAVKKIAETVKNSTICSLARAKAIDIERAAEAIKPAANGRIHTFISTSPIHMKAQIKMDEAAVLENVKSTVSLARNLCSDVEFSAMDATRSDKDFLCRTLEIAIANGASTVNIPDTVGYTVPTEYAELINYIKNNVSNIDKAIISVHCHNDLGLAVANSLAAIEAGARQIECTINGIGERAGNAAMEELVMILKTRQNILEYQTNVDCKYFARASRLVSNATGFNVQNNKAIVGANAFAHESGIHQDGMLKDRNTYEIINPEDVGFTETLIVMGKHSGRHAFKNKLTELGFDLTAEQIEKYFTKFKTLADDKKEVYDEDIITLIGSRESLNKIKFVNLEVNCGSTENTTASLTLSVDDKQINQTDTGNGPVDAIFNAIRHIIPHNARLDLYQVHSVTKGTDAQAEVTVRLEDQQGRIVSGHASHTDTMVASAKSYISALNKMFKRDSEKPIAQNISI
ncbi:MAG: 2-isopropylmalate synthase [Rickettsiales bacterium]|jgi:2-isopropylmalate synthase|nr:2-isopropylmalate synthase [Rickettsiales bacterium]